MSETPLERRLSRLIANGLKPASAMALESAARLYDVHGVPGVLLTRLPERPDGQSEMQLVVGKNLQILFQ